jgi:hypothetical protein
MNNSEVWMLAKQSLSNYAHFKKVFVFSIRNYLHNIQSSHITRINAQRTVPTEFNVSVKVTNSLRRVNVFLSCEKCEILFVIIGKVLN